MKDNRYCSSFALVILFCLLAACEKEVSVSEPLPPEPLGHMFVDSYPGGARIFLNNKNTGFVTPDTIKFLELKEQQLILKKELWKDYEKVIIPTDQEVKEHNADFRTVPGAQGSVRINANVDNLIIQLDSTEILISPPYTIENLFPGEYFIKGIKNVHRSDSTSFTISSSNLSYATLSLIDTSIWVNYNSSNSSLPTNHLTDIELDHEGKIWLGSFAGLINFDGYEFTVYNRDNSILPNNQINCLFSDSKGELWIGTSLGLLKKSGSNWQLFTSNNSNLSDDFISCIDEGPDGAIWIGTSHGINKILDGSWDVYTMADGLSSNWILAICANQHNDIIASTNAQGLNIFKKDYWFFNENDERVQLENVWIPYIVIPEYTYPTGTVTHIEADRHGYYWCIFLPDDLIEPPELAVFNHYRNPGDIHEMKVFTYEQKFESLYIDALDNKWICTRNGMTLYDSENQSSYIGTADGFEGNASAMKMDSRGTYWMATTDRGLIKYKRNLLE